MADSGSTATPSMVSPWRTWSRLTGSAFLLMDAQSACRITGCNTNLSRIPARAPAARRGIGICSGDSYRSGETTGLNCGVARRKHSQSYAVSILLQSGAISLPRLCHILSLRQCQIALSAPHPPLPPFLSHISLLRLCQISFPAPPLPLPPLNDSSASASSPSASSLIHRNSPRSRGCKVLSERNWK